MTTKIIHYRNSFVDIIDDSMRILMDPWVNNANHGAWSGTKNGAKYIFKTLSENPIKYIYISHLHTDHYDKEFISKLAKNNKHKIYIIVKKFKDQRFKKKILSEKIKNTKVLEFNSYEKIALSDKSSFWILPQLSASNTPNYLVNYDLDTSCIFKNKDVSIFNQVDNPYSIQDINKLKTAFKKNNLPKNFDVSFISYCAASAYPQNFININRDKIRKNLIKNRLIKFFEISKKINSKYVVPAGGSYKLDKDFSYLNKFKAIPDFKFISNFKKNNNYKTNLVDTKKKFFYFNSKFEFKDTDFKNCFEAKIQKNKISYPKCKKFNKEMILKDLYNVEKNLAEWKKNIYNKCSTAVHLYISKDSIKIKKKPSKKDFPIKHVINFGNIKNKKNTLKILINYKLLYAFINSKISYNEIETHLLYSRKPDRYEPDIHFWMNLYKF